MSENVDGVFRPSCGGGGALPSVSSSSTPLKYKRKTMKNEVDERGGEKGQSCYEYLEECVESLECVHVSIE